MIGFIAYTSWLGIVRFDWVEQTSLSSTLVLTNWYVSWQMTRCMTLQRDQVCRGGVGNRQWTYIYMNVTGRSVDRLIDFPSYSVLIFMQINSSPKYGLPPPYTALLRLRRTVDWPATTHLDDLNNQIML